MRSTLGALWCLTAVGLGGCATQPPDPFVTAERLAESGDLLKALPLLDKVPPVHVRYGEARALAQALERRMRTSHELVLRGMTMRSEWKDKEALRLFQHALKIWPSVAGAEVFMQATENRMRALEEVRRSERWFASPDGGNPGFDQVQTVPLGIEPSAPRRQVPRRQAPKPDQPETEDVRVARQLRAVKERLERGEMEQAMDLLEALVLDFPENRTAGSRLAQLLHERALLRYGQGFLEGAIEDWRRLLKMRPKHPQAAAFLQAAETELELRGRG